MSEAHGLVHDPPTSPEYQNSFDFLLDMNYGTSQPDTLPVDTGAFEVPNYPPFISVNNALQPPVEGQPSAPSQVFDSHADEPSVLDDDLRYDFFINDLPEIDLTLPGASDQPTQSSEPNHPRYLLLDPHPARSSGQSHSKSIDEFIHRAPLPAKASKPFIQPYNASDRSSLERWGPVLASSIIRQLRLDDCKENQSLVRTSLARGYNVREVFLAGLAALGKRDAEISSELSDPHSNALTLVPSSTLQAFLSIAVSLKISIPEMHAASCQSPFYQPEAMANRDLTALEATWSSSLPKDMRPTPAQIKFPHHPWLDIIPFPPLRDRAITLHALDPPMIDLNDLKTDIFLNSGLFCWRAGGAGGTGQPWDMRSWEAEPWFLQKWWMLVGGETGEVWEQTRWWRTMRGKANVEMSQVS